MNPIPEFTTMQLLKLARIELATADCISDGMQLKEHALHINGHQLVDVIRYHEKNAPGFTEMTTAIPEEEGDYLCQFKDGSVEMITMDEIEIEYLHGSRTYMKEHLWLDKLFSWMPMESLPPLPTIPKKPRPHVDTMKVA